MDELYELYRRGSELLADGHNHQAAIPLRQARDLSPESSSIREALGRALFHTQHYAEAAEEFRAVTQKSPTNDYALFCLGRCLQLLGRHAEARIPLTMASTLKPDRRDYRMYRERSASASGNTSTDTGQPPPPEAD